MTDVAILERPFTIAFNGVPMSDGEIDAMDLAASSRALRLLRETIGWERMLEMLGPRIEESARRWEGWLAVSNGRLVATPQYFEITGLDVDEFLPWFMRKIEDQEFNWFMHPEHFVWATIDRDWGQYRRGDKLVVEPWGSYMHIGTLTVLDYRDIDTCGEADDDYPVKFAGASFLPDGTLKKTVFYQYRRTAAGFIVKCAGGNPPGLPDDVRIGMREHLQLEWAKAFRLARAEFVGKRPSA